MSVTSDTIEFDRSEAAGALADRPRRDPGGERAPDDSHGYRAAVRRFRSRRTLAASLVAAVLAIAATAGAIEVISYLVDRPSGLLPVDGLARVGRETRWEDPLVLIVAAVAGLIGLLLLALAVLPGRARVIPVAAGLDQVILALRPAALERHAAAAAEAVPGVEHAVASVRGRRLRVRVESWLRDPGDLADQVRQAVAERVDQLAPLRRPRLQVHLRHRKD